MSKALLIGCLCLFSVAPQQTNAGMLSATNDYADIALIACLRAHPIVGEREHTGDTALADAELHMQQCKLQMKASMLECGVAGYSDDECALSLMAFTDKVINGK